MDCQFVIALKFHMLQFKGGVFKVATLDKWMVVVCDPVLVDELRKAPHDELSFDGAVIDVCSSPLISLSLIEPFPLF
jgi:hypothetical protein